MIINGRSTYCCVILLCITTIPYSAVGEAVKVSWLGEDAPKTAVGINFGIPWKKGKLLEKAELCMKDAQGTNVPIASWPLAYWPDGSVKWTGIGCVVSSKYQAPFSISRDSMQRDGKLVIKETGDAILINTDKFLYEISKKGSRLIKQASVGNKAVSANLRLTAYSKNSPNPNEKHIASDKYTSSFHNVLLEQSDPVRAVVKAEGVLHCDNTNRDILPFTLRLYFYSGIDTLNAIFSFVYDANQSSDFIAGLGVKLDIPMREDPLNRHLIYAGRKNRTWHEAVRLMEGRPSKFKGLKEDLYERQMNGQAIPSIGAYSDAQQKIIRELPQWNDFKLVQNSADSFTVFKRTNKESCWLNAGWGLRSQGVAFAGDTSGGVIIGVKDFWQSYPSSIEINNATTNRAEMTMWLWSPDAPAMDMRHYDTKGHSLKAVYEDYQKGYSTPYGIARTFVISLSFFDKNPDVRTFNDYASDISDPPLLTCEPRYYHSIPVFGVWSLPDRSSSSKKWIEEKLDIAVNHFLNEVEQQHWYGFWDYGDVMHQYDPVRHKWKYDIGGFAWANTELAPNIWLWYSFLRTGRKDIFRMAEAMTRHTQEVDTYHIGPMKGLGSRHNVRHWGGGAKEPRIAHAGYHRFYYYLTADERTGDVMNEVINADYSTVNIPPLRKIIKDYYQKHGLDPKDYNFPTYIRSGPDWISFVANWMTAWERTKDEKYRDWILTGMNDFINMPYGLHTSFIYGYDPATKHLYPITKAKSPSAHHLMVTMGGFEVMAELNQLIDYPQWQKIWLDFCEKYNWSPSEWRRKAGVSGKPGGFPVWHARLTGYAANAKKDPQLAKRAWKEFLGHTRVSHGDKFPSEPVKVSGLSVLNDSMEIPDVTTNNYSQWSLNAIELLELVGDYIPKVSD